MHKVIFSIIVLFCCFSLSAQEIKVKSMELLQSDLSARTNPRLDGNDEPCALIKVIVPAVEGIQFEGWVIGNVKYRPGEYQVYVPAGTKKITFRHPDFAPGEIRFTIPIEGKCTYRVVLETPKKVGGLESVEKGDAAAMLKQAKNYEQGTGSYSRNIEQAQEWYEKAAEAGSIEAQEYLAEVLYKGTKGFTRHQEKALKWNEVCAQRGNTSCYLPLAELYTLNKQNEEVIKWLRKHCEAKQNDVPQVLRLGRLIGVDKQEGFKWLNMASEAGNKEATSLCLQQMRKKSPKDAVPFYKRAIDGGDMAAANEYAQILMEGKFGIPKDEIEAQRLFELAASTIFSTYADYKSDDPDFQSYINKIPTLISKAKTKDIKAMISLILIYRALGDNEMEERMLTVVRYNISKGMKLPHTFDYYLEQKAKYDEMDYENLIYGGLDFNAVNKNSYFTFMRDVIDYVILAPNPSYQFLSKYAVRNANNTPKKEVGKLLIKWAKSYYDNDCLSKLEDPVILKNLSIDMSMIKNSGKKSSRDNVTRYNSWLRQLKKDGYM